MSFGTPWGSSENSPKAPKLGRLVSKVISTLIGVISIDTLIITLVTKSLDPLSMDHIDKPSQFCGLASRDECNVVFELELLLKPKKEREVLSGIKLFQDAEMCVHCARIYIYIYSAIPRSQGCGKDGAFVYFFPAC